MIAVNRKVFFLFLPVAILVALISYGIIQSTLFLIQPDILSLAITVDLVLFLPLFYFFIIRKSNISKFTIIPVVILSFVTANTLLPSTDKTYLKLAEMLLAPLEIFAVGYIIYKVRLVTKTYKSLTFHGNDFVENLRSSLFQVFRNKAMVNLASTEISVFYYGIFGWNKRIESRNETAFTYHKRAGYAAIVGVFFFMIILETISLHLLLSNWSNTAAWILAAVNMYGLVFLSADFNAAKKRPILIDNNKLHLRIAFRWFVAIPFENIKQVYAGAETKNNDKTYFRMVLIGSENVIIELHKPIRATGLYGITKTFNRVGLSVDNKSDFVELIRGNMLQT